MAQDRVYTAAEAASAAGVSEANLADWIREKLVAPSVLADGQEALLDDGDLVVVRQIKDLAAIGYGSAEIRKIARKVGLPKPGRKGGRSGRARRYLTVGELAKRAGVNARTIKYWEERGIIEPTGRSDGGFRLYDEGYVLFCNLIQDLQNFGYSLEEIKEEADLFRVFNEMHGGRYEGTDEQAAEALALMDRRIEALYARMELLTKGIARWRKLVRERHAEIGALRKRSAKAAKVQAASDESPETVPSSS